MLARVDCQRVRILLEHSRAVDDDFGRVLEDLACRIVLHLYRPPAADLAPYSAEDRVVELGVVVESVLHRLLAVKVKDLLGADIAGEVSVSNRTLLAWSTYTLDHSGLPTQG